jgi:hypothetical protein
MQREVHLGYLYDDVGHGGPFHLIEKETAVTIVTPFMEVVEEIVAMHLKKQADYGRTGDPFANVRASADFGVDAWKGCMIRANDKMRRIQSFAIKGSLENESLEDSLLDLAVYSIIALVLRREQVAKENFDTLMENLPLVELEEPTDAALRALEAPELRTGEPVVEWAQGNYIQWGEVVAKLDRGQINEFHCVKKHHDSAATSKTALLKRQPHLRCQLIDLDDGRTEMVVTLWSIE